MKKLITIMTVILFCFVLTSCDPGHFYYDYNDLSESVVSIELISYDNPKAKSVPDHLGNARHLDFDFEKTEYIEELKEKMHDDFFESISDKMILNHVWHQDSPNGLCVMINYDNGDFDIVSGLYIGRFDRTGKFKQYLGVLDSGVDRAIIYEYFDVKTALI